MNANILILTVIGPPKRFPPILKTEKPKWPIRPENENEPNAYKREEYRFRSSEKKTTLAAES